MALEHTRLEIYRSGVFKNNTESFHERVFCVYSRADHADQGILSFQLIYMWPSLALLYMTSFALTINLCALSGLI